MEHQGCLPVNALSMLNREHGFGRAGEERGRHLRTAFLLSGLALAVASPALAQTKPPYWASISAGEARMRTGPGKQFPISWLYRRAGLPVMVIKTYPNWRMVRDPDGTEGWVQATLLSEDHTALVKAGEIRTMQEAPDAGAKTVWRVEPGVVGRLTECAKGWCKLDVKGRAGYIEAVHLWGAEAPGAAR